jgi:hypothetical protein
MALSVLGARVQAQAPATEAGRGARALGWDVETAADERLAVGSAAGREASTRVEGRRASAWALAPVRVPARVLASAVGV